MAPIDVGAGLLITADDLKEHYKLYLDFIDTQSGAPHTKRPRTAILGHENRQIQPSSFVCHDFGLDVIFIGNHYAPCQQSLAHLESTLLAKLLINHHNRGKFLLAKLVSILTVSRTTTTAGIEDISGDVEMLAINSACMNTAEGHEWPELGHWFVIKEPFLTEQEDWKGPCIRVDHPSDLVDAQSLPLDLRDREPFVNIFHGKTKRTPFQYKEAGNGALRAEENSAAHAYYTEGLLLAAGATDEVQQDLHRNRSEVRLILGQYEGAVADALAAMTHVSDDKHKRLDTKAYFRAASASYMLKQFGKAKQLLQTALRLVPKDQDVLALLTRTQARLREQESGHYDICKINARLATSRSVDAADYILSTTIKSSIPSRGRGLFARRGFKLGDLIMAETAFCDVWDQEDHRALRCNAENTEDLLQSQSGLWRALTKKMSDNPTSGNEILQLHSKYKSSLSRIVEIDGVGVVDTFQTSEVVAYNAFATPTNQDSHSAAIFTRSSYINHSCIPNAQKISVGNLALVHAIRPIAKDEEITISYTGSKRNEERPGYHTKDWGFLCDCLLCQTDSKCPSASRELRAELTTAFRKTYPSESPLNEYHVDMVAPLQDYARKIAATYDTELYSDLPKTALLPVHFALLRAWISAVEHAKITLSSVDLLRVLGLKVDMKYGIIVAIHCTANSVLPMEALVLCVPIACEAGDAQRLRLPDVARHVLDFASSLERAYTGRNDETLAAYKLVLESNDSLPASWFRSS